MVGGPTPDWFQAALSTVPERPALEVEGTSIELLSWGKTGDQPDLLLIHGNGAHADWWRFIAPLLAIDRRVAAFSLSGMGNSTWRNSYSVELHAHEAIAAAAAAGLFDGDHKPWIVAHSFGSAVAVQCLDRIAHKIAGLIIADNGVHHAPLSAPSRTGTASKPPVLYQDRDTILRRFRLQPAQPCANDYILRFLAETSIIETELGWRWKFDPSAQGSRGIDHRVDFRDRIAAASIPLAFLFGEASIFMTAEVIARTRDAAAPGTRFVGIPAAGHHLMLDQPLAFVTAVRALTA